MWRLVKTLEEENERLRKELEVWAKKALHLSKQVYLLERNGKRNWQPNATESAERKSGRTAQRNQLLHEREDRGDGNASADAI